MKVPSCSSFGFWSLLVFCSLFVIANANIHQDEDDAWIDPYDMLNYDPTTKRMRKPTETTTSINPVCLPVFKRFLSRLLKETSKLGLPDDGQTSMHYDAEVKLSKQSLMEIQKLLNEENDWTTGAMDEALSQILLRFKLHDHEAWKWRFEDTFYVDADTALKVSLIVLIVVAIISTELWSVVCWFVQFRRMFAVCFFISLIWNWFHLYMVIILVSTEKPTDLK
uniref:Chloride channel CLIC-like protein 1 n=1 Tax=Sinocyclocheilus anshuiensis TaxID=1608454 RepID=A0A671N5G7_9TELE